MTQWMLATRWTVGIALAIAALAAGSEEPWSPKPVPPLQIMPLPYDQAAFVRDGVEIARYHFGSGLRRPFLYPIMGPAGRSLTRMGHPWDPESHSHHNSVWVSHNDVEGVGFWSDQNAGRIIHRRIVGYEDGGRASKIVTENEWVAPNGGTLLRETRQVAVVVQEERQWLLLIDLDLRAADKAVTLGKTPFGMVGVRMAKSIGVHDGNGRIRNSAGGVNEAEVFWKPARWVDYSGAIADQTVEGITLLDHPDNPNHPSVFHVRNDGWMGACLTFDGPRAIEPDKPLRLRYGLWVHAGMATAARIDQVWEQFATLDTEVLERRSDR